MKRLVPYAGTEQPRLRWPHNKPRREDTLASIIERQKQGMLLSEIGAEFGSLRMVRAAVLTWLFEVPA